MAYLPQQIPDEEKNKFGNTNQTTPNPLPPQTGGSAGTGTNAAPGVGTSTQFGSNAAKLSDYLKANAPQVQQFGSQVAGNLTKGYNDTMDTINQGFGNFNQSVNQGWAQPNQDKINEAASNPTQFAQNPENVSQFQSWYNNQYTGPQSFETSEPYSNVNSAVNKAVQNANLTNSFSGLGSYLNNFMGTSGHTPGMNTLDTALLQRNPEAASAIKEAAAPYKGLNDYFSNKTQEGNKNVASAKSGAEQTRTGLQNQFTGEGGVIPSFQSDINQRLASARGASQSEQENIRRILGNPSGSFNELNKVGNEKLSSDLGLSSNELQKMGWTEDQLRDVYGMLKDQSGNPYYSGDNFALQNYATYENPESAITPENFASKEDYAKAQALQQLTGQPGAFNTSNPNLAGTANNMDLVNYDKVQAMNDRSGLLTGFDKQFVDRFSAGDPTKWLENNKYLLDQFKTTGEISPGLASLFTGGENASLNGSPDLKGYINAFSDALTRGKYYTPPEGTGSNVPPPPPPPVVGRPFIPPPIFQGGNQTPTDENGLPILGMV